MSRVERAKAESGIMADAVLQLGEAGCALSIQDAIAQLLLEQQWGESRPDANQ